MSRTDCTAGRVSIKIIYFPVEKKMSWLNSGLSEIIYIYSILLKFWNKKTTRKYLENNSKFFEVSSGFLITANLLTVYCVQNYGSIRYSGWVWGFCFLFSSQGFLFEFSVYNHSSLRISPFTLSFYQNLTLSLTPLNSLHS